MGGSSLGLTVRTEVDPPSGSLAKQWSLRLLIVVLGWRSHVDSVVLGQTGHQSEGHMAVHQVDTKSATRCSDSEHLSGRVEANFRDSRSSGLYCVFILRTCCLSI